MAETHRGGTRGFGLALSAAAVLMLAVMPEATTGRSGARAKP